MPGMQMSVINMCTGALRISDKASAAPEAHAAISISSACQSISSASPLCTSGSSSTIMILYMDAPPDRYICILTFRTRFSIRIMQNHQ
jgi:hypothetical protein